MRPVFVDVILNAASVYFSHREDTLFGLENISQLFDKYFYHSDVFSTLDSADDCNLLLSLIFFHPRFSVGCV